MIKGISLIRKTGDAASYERLSRFFAALGFAPGRGWENSPRPDAGQASRGASFLAPGGNLELVDGALPPFADIAVEVTSLDAVHQAAAEWLRAEGLETAA